MYAVGCDLKNALKEGAGGLKEKFLHLSAERVKTCSPSEVLHCFVFLFFLTPLSSLIIQ